MQGGLTELSEIDRQIKGIKLPCFCHCCLQNAFENICIFSLSQLVRREKMNCKSKEERKQTGAKKTATKTVMSSMKKITIGLMKLEVNDEEIGKEEKRGWDFDETTQMGLEQGQNGWWCSEVAGVT